MSSATEELRALLDEMGVEWKDIPIVGGYTITRWHTPDGHIASYCEDWRGCTVGMDATPAQAIEATLGRGTIDRDAAVERVGRFTVEYAVLLDKARGLDPAGGEFGRLEQAEVALIYSLVDDLATLGRGECVNLGRGGDFLCDECGYSVEGTGNFGESISYCPNCGRKVVD